MKQWNAIEITKRLHRYGTFLANLAESNHALSPSTLKDVCNAHRLVTFMFIIFGNRTCHEGA